MARKKENAKGKPRRKQNKPARPAVSLRQRQRSGARGGRGRRR